MTGVQSSHIRGPMGTAVAATESNKDLDAVLGINYLK